MDDDEILVSDCCGAEGGECEDHDRCPRCGENCDFVVLGEEE